jgi:hypothetical protein
MLAAAARPAYDETLVALEREFRPVDREAVLGALDDLARPLFGLGDAAPDARVLALARAAWSALPAEGAAPPAWLLASALEAGRATGAVRAVVAVELGRRAGISAVPARLRGGWAVCVYDAAARISADVGSDPTGAAPGGGTGRCCAHQLAFAVLTGLARAWESEGRAARARRACGLRLLLPLDDDLRRAVQQEVRARGSAA